MSTALPARSGRASASIPRAPQERAERIPLLYREPLELLVLALLVLLGLTLNHSSVIFGVNLSLADPVVAVLALGLALSGRLWIPVGPLVFFVLLSVQLLVVTVLLVPTWTSIPIPASDTILDFTKLAVSFLCLVIGVQVVRTGHARLVLRAFVIGSVMVSGIAVVAQVAPLPGTGSLFYGGFRYEGLTNDPNNFAVMTVAALAALWYDRGVRVHLSIIASAVLISGVLLSASKTGAITLALLVVWRAMGIRTPLGADSDSLSRRLLAAFTALGIAVLVLLVAPSTGAGGTLAEFTSHVPALDRLSTLLVSFDTAIAGNGSERSAAWFTAFALILASPLLGVGLGTYLPVAVELTGHEVLAHNTYLQIMAEWGVPFALVLLLWAARATLWRPQGTRHHALWATSSTTFLVLLVGSVGLSLNNSRLFWFILGITVATHMFSTKDQPTDTSGESPQPSGTSHEQDALDDPGLMPFPRLGGSR
ncbi:O-antigen ligase family protein [Brachybacterium alimentarium]|uniref:O-antigen ligase family protein n=1 Tax=Brachybacterium alimentarium TaxID=47845 RepID=UPI0015EFEAA1|nr:O-antigen ligase family protein [Brachybacterium alimentarium]